MSGNDSGRFFSWPWGWQAWSLPQPILNRMGLGEPATGYMRSNGIHPASAAEEGDEELPAADLVRFADDLAHLIQPVLPDPAFRSQLKLTLIASHPQNTTRRLPFSTGPEAMLQPWQVIATVPVLVGVAALIWRYRPRSEAQPSEAA